MRVLHHGCTAQEVPKPTKVPKLACDLDPDPEKWAIRRRAGETVMWRFGKNTGSILLHSEVNNLPIFSGLEDICLVRLSRSFITYGSYHF